MLSYFEIFVPNVSSMYAREVPLQMREGAAVGIMMSHLLVSLYNRSLLPPNEEGVGEGLRGVLWRWVIVGVVGVRSRWVGGCDPLEI